MVSLTNPPPSSQRVSFDQKLWHIGPYAWATMEFMGGCLAMLVAYRLTPASLATAAERHVPAMEAALLYGILLTVSAHAIGLHNNLNLKNRSRIVILGLVNTGLAVTLLTLFVSVVLYGQIGRIILLVCTALTVIVSTAFRLAVHRHIEAHPLHVYIAGDSTLQSFIADISRTNAGHLIFHNDTTSAERYDIIIVPVSKLGSLEAEEPFLKLANQGIQVFTPVAFVEFYFYLIPAQYISAAWLFSIDLHRLHPFYHQIKRGLDILFSATGLVLTAPLMAAAAAAIRLESPGPIFYSQIRVGLFQRPFRIWKLRTMRADAEQNGPQWASVGDRRVTWVGRVLRKTRIDELPQFWNILHGDMAFVGPRPERPEFVEQLAREIPFYKQRHLVKPGLTGWAQICYPYGASSQDAWNKLSYDFYYIKNSSMTLDMQILLQTVGAVSRGAR